ncbi:ABC transporter permease [Aliirhizobium cellulosilyticum]|jgi:NitT/TauT family transport system permease protein|uniref:NitT/TauT family transport system permease protein n=1 Tax=Aliirhizobium cellulosilyticum TaxID=393664 RepID=A0A7W6S4J0_9HYPH|nr:ABC transporter permease [Rhizobium cellulosilyticum]MBB4346949.1 NitT/TauT family transport system permease protein [Rhizobium cellulosilyticum]MBB4410657.1 NitT/TauT family transport system permease protein [Rhizobium cellulosilyticum]MBB4445345.1 NitT/TauT family transport system permease protein [Rhizobium cellulosilyticum]
MTILKRSWQSWLALALILAALATLPLLSAEAPIAYKPIRMFSIFVLTIGATVVSLLSLPPVFVAVTLLVCAHFSTGLLISRLAGNEGMASTAFFLILAANWLLAWRCVSILSELRIRSRAIDSLLRLIIPAIFGAWILILWEAATRGLGIPFIILPPPSAIGARFASSIPTLWADVQQTVFKAVIFGYLVGCASGFAVAILADRIAFFRRGLLPIANLMSALPIIGVAPIMVMWFGFDWQSKAAVVIVMTFFPMLVNTIAGLSAAGSMERDLMRSYASDYWQTLTKLRLPAAMPFIFNALKINSTLALIGAIVAEFFGTPIVGMGFRISTEIGRMNVDMVWAEITVAAIVGSIFYGVVALGERALTFWHPSNRGG